MSNSQKARQKFIIIVIILLCICISLPILFHEDFFSTFTSLIMAFCSIITLFIAIMLYDKYGIEHTIKDKNFTAVNKLMEDLSNMNLSVILKKNGNVSHVLCNIDFQSNYKKRSDWLSPEELSTQLLFTRDTINMLSKIFSTANRDLYMPPEIVEKVNSMHWGAFSVVKEEINAMQFWVAENWESASSIIDKTLWTIFEPITLCVFLEYLDNVKQSCVKWLHKNGGDGSLNATPYINS